MLKTELLEIIVNGENSGVEFKRDVIRPAAASQICAITVCRLLGYRVRTKIVPLTCKDPEFKATEDYLKTTLYR